VSHVRDGKQERPKDRQPRAEAPPTRGDTPRASSITVGVTAGSESRPAP
jgi:hypothetical protein